MDEVPRPEIKRLCKVCRVTETDVKKNCVVVSPTGTAHYGQYEMTHCGKHAAWWWWPL